MGSTGFSVYIPPPTADEDVERVAVVGVARARHGVERARRVWVFVQNVKVRVVAVQVAFESKGLKPVFQFHRLKG
jgi:hypothetical protein